MTVPRIGWHQADPPPDGHRFSTSLERRGSHLSFEGIDLASLFSRGQRSGKNTSASAQDLGLDLGLDLPLPSPLEVAYLPRIEERIHSLQEVFREAQKAFSYEGEFLYFYASKANTAEEIVRTTLNAGAHHEMSSYVDVEIVRLMVQRGHLPPDRLVLANGFKPPGSRYSEALFDLARSGTKVIPIFDDLSELEPFLKTDVHLEVGLRQKTYGLQKDPDAGADAVDSRFGLMELDLQKAAELIERAPHLTLRVHHAMLGSQMTQPEDYGAGLEPALKTWAKLREGGQHPQLNIFNFGGGVPARMTLDFEDPFLEIAAQILGAAQRVAEEHGLPAPHIAGEMGRYTTAEHAAHLFQVIAVKDNESPLPWYLIDGSIMTSFPDIWAIGEHFTVLPLNHLDRPFRKVRLGGITCDSDDIYPQRSSQAELWLPEVTASDDLHVGFFFVGAYQEMLGGVRGSKHCVLPEACELLIERGPSGKLEARRIEGHRTIDVLGNLGYVEPNAH